MSPSGAARGSWRIPVLVAAVALMIRLWCVLRGGGLYGYYGYDDGVYYSAAAALVFGHLPYRDFVLLHPPGIMLVLAPFAELGRLTSDREAMAVARVAFLMVGALNAALAARVASVCGRWAALVAGGFSAVWVYSVYADRTTLLEPLGNTALLVALLLLQRHRRLSDRAAQMFAGLALGLGACVKIWGCVPLAIVGLAVVATLGWRAGVRLAAGAAAAGIVVCGPFLLAAPQATVRMIVLDQIGRPGDGRSVQRWPAILGVTTYLPTWPPWATVLLAAAVAAVMVALTLLALRDHRARQWVVLLVTHLLVLFAGPVYFAHYSAFLTVPLSLTLGAAAGVVSGSTSVRGSRVAAGALAVTAVLPLLALAGGTAAHPLGARFPGPSLAAFVPAQGCVRADDATALVELDVLSRNLRRHCPVVVDFTGLTYDRLARHDAQGKPISRRANKAWQQHARAYLLSGSATILVRGRGNGFSRPTRAALHNLPALARIDGYTLLGRSPMARRPS